MPNKIWSLGEDGLPPDNDPMWSAMARESINDSQSVNRPEDPRIAVEAASAQYVRDSDFERLKAAISDFVRREYDDDLTPEAFDNPACIGIAETTAEDREDIVIDMAVNVPDLTLDQYINGDKTDSWHYANINALIGEIKHISFDELVSLGPNAERRVDQLIAQFPYEHDFIRTPEDSYAIYQLKNDPAFHELRFASFAELQRDAKAMRDSVHAAVEKAEDMLFGDKAAVERYLRTEGFTILPNEDPALITMVSPARLQSTIYLTYGNDCCSIDGCDTRGVEHLVNRDHYQMVYSGCMPDECLGMKNPDDILERLYCKFNLDRPKDFRGHSLSVSDVITLKQDGQVASFYTDSFGFVKLSDFSSHIDLNHLRSAEMAMEDDYNMIDIINNGPKEERAVTPDKEKIDSPSKSEKTHPKKADKEER